MRLAFLTKIKKRMNTHTDGQIGMNKIGQYISRFALVLIMLLAAIAGPLACSHSAGKAKDIEAPPTLMQYKVHELPGALPANIPGIAPEYANEYAQDEPGQGFEVYEQAALCFADSVYQIRQQIAQQRSELYFINRRLSADDEPPTRTASVSVKSDSVTPD